MNIKNKYPRMLGRDMLTLKDFSSVEIEAILELAGELKSEHKNRVPHRYLEGKSLAMIFQKSSTRTRVSFEVGMCQLGGSALFLRTNDLQLARGELFRDTARTLSRYVDGIMIRTYEQSEVEELAEHATVPVINGLTDMFHPCQALADLLTIKELKGSLAGVKLAYFGDGNNVAHSLMLGGAKMGMEITVCTPPEYAPNEDVVSVSMAESERSGGKIILSDDPSVTVRDSDIIYTDVWTSMGQEEESAKRMKLFKPYQVNMSLIRMAKETNPIVMHCLPAHRNEEITDEVFELSAGTIFEQAENRLHVQKAIMTLVM